MRSFSLGYLIGRGFKGLTRNSFMSFASILILTSCLLISGCFGMLVYNIYVNFNNLNELNEIVCVCKYDVTEEQLSSLGDRLKALDNVEAVTFKSKDEALADLKELFSEYPQIFERITKGENPLPDVFTVKYIDSDQAVNLAYELKNVDDFPEFKSVDDKIDVAKTLDELKNTVLWIFLSFMAVLLLISVIIIMNTVSISISTRSKEITVMRYVGATNRFITFPFYMETFVVGFISTAIAFGLQFLAYDRLVKYIFSDAELNSLIIVVPFGDIWYWLLPAFLAVALVTCFIGAAIALSKHIKV